ncbi:MAG: tyrosine-protein phosphatase [Proteobacteria bacterium]|nr:tyrosine-protein phosphatase [Pseudomonadota bacterium]
MPHPTRSLHLEGASNFRDLGGYPAAAGQQVRWRCLFRSDQLAGLTADDLQRLQALGLARAFDLRGMHERAATPYQLPGVVQHALPIEPTVVQLMKDLLEAGRKVTAQDTVRLMEQTYRAFVHDNAARFAELFGHLLESDTPLVFHCTAGKDRTGFAAALILLALGVPRETVMQDYLLTNDLFRAPPIDAGRAPREVVQVLWRVQREFLDAALHAVDADWGGIDRYLSEALRIDAVRRSRLAELYLRRPQDAG